MLRLSGSDLACVRGSRTVFTGLNLELCSGQALVLTGPNGAGKSTLLRLVAGLIQPEKGRIELTGQNGDRSVPECSHYLGHLDALKTSLTVTENLTFWMGYLGAVGGGGDLADLPVALDAVGLGNLSHLPAAYLSAGQRRRLSLARLIAVSRPLWLLDEPTSALDSAGCAMLAGLMRRHLSGGGMIMGATHGPLGIEAKEMRLGAAA